MTVGVYLSANDGPPASAVYVSGVSFGAFEGVDVYFDTAALALAGTDAAGHFGPVLSHVPAAAGPGIHLISAAGRESGLFAQVPFTVNADWAQFGYAARHGGWNPHENTLSPDNVSAIDLDWTFSTDYFVSSPAVVNGVIYIGSGNEATGAGAVHALDAATGAELWNFPAGNIVASSPAVAGGVVYVGSGDGNVYALDAATGTELWNSPAGTILASSPAVAGGVVYVGSGDRNVYALDAATGARLWIFTTGEPFVSTSPAVAGGVVYVGSGDNNVYALDAATGTKLWNFTTGSPVESSPAVANGVVYIGSNDGNVYALDPATGAELWNFTIGSFINSSPAVANGVVYIGSEDTNVYALDSAVGTELWKFTTGAAIFSSPAVANGVVYIGSDDGNVYALSAATGKRLWSYRTGAPCRYYSPAVVNGVAYFGSAAGQLRAFTDPARLYYPAISRVAGTGTQGDSGDGGPATSAQLFGPAGIAVTPDAGFLIADMVNQVVRVVSPAGVITRAAGNGTPGYSGDGGPAISAQLNWPMDVAAVPGGGFLIADNFNHVVRVVSPAGVISTAAGNGTAGYSGDGGPATSAQLYGPTSVSAFPGGGFLIADWANHVVRVVSPAGVISTAAGNGTAGYSGDGGPATSAQLNAPIGVSALPGGGYLIADTGNNAVRMVSPAGVISTVAGDGTAGNSGDGGPATSARLNQPGGVAAVAGGGFLISDSQNNVVRMVSAAGVITRVAGNGAAGYSGDGGPATSAQLDDPPQVAVTLDGGFLIADVAHSVVRKVAAGW
jgi:outer membrane protein assembly factor BamB